MVRNVSTTSSNDSDHKSSKDCSTDDYFSSLAFRNPVLYDHQHTFHENSFEPVPLNKETENKLSSKNIIQFQMIDGTYWRYESDLNYGRLFTTFGAIAAVDFIAFQYASEVWYREETTTFHTLNFNNDLNKKQYMD